MIRSMTGFAAVAADLPGVALAVELRSVNHRFLDLQLRLPDELRGLAVQVAFYAGWPAGLSVGKAALPILQEALAALMAGMKQVPGVSTLSGGQAGGAKFLPAP